MTCKQLIEQLHEAMWTCFWLSISVHLFLGVFIPLALEFFRAVRDQLKRNKD